MVILWWFYMVILYGDWMGFNGDFYGDFMVI